MEARPRGLNPEGSKGEAVGRKERPDAKYRTASREAFPFYISSCHPPHHEHEKGLLQDTVAYEQGQGGAPWVAPDGGRRVQTLPATSAANPTGAR